MVRVQFDTGNAAFAGMLGFEAARCLRRVADKIEAGEREGAVMDINGNTVGRFRVTGSTA